MVLIYWGNMKKETVSVCVLGLSKPWGIDIQYNQKLTDQENILVALSFAASSAVREELTKPLYEVIFELKDGKKVLGYSDADEPDLNGKFYYCAATKELKGRVIVAAESVTSFRFTPL